MKKTKSVVKITSFLLLSFLAATNVIAQEFDSDFTDSESEDFSDSSFDSSFGDSDFSSWDFDSDSGTAFSASANLSSDIRYYFDGNDSKDGTNIENWTDFTNLPVEANPSATVNLGYSGKVDAEVTFNVNESTISDYPEDIIDELLLRSYFGDNFILEVGKMKTVWGKGDKLHVFDNFNADNYTDFIIPDYNDRRIATPMVRASYAFPFSSNLNVEAVYTPFLPVDRFSTSDRWTPAQVASIKNTITTSATAAITNATTALEEARIEALTASELKARVGGGDTSAQTALETLVNNAVNNGYISVTSDEELKRLIVHGLLHLMGMDHGEEHIEKDAEPACEMLKLQEKILSECKDFHFI